jgi:hypothetical protein
MRFAGFTLLLLLAIVAGCSSSEPEAEPAEWGVEAVEYFARLADAYKDNDIYGILDFYTPVAEIEMRRADNRGSSLVRDLIKWNSADLGVDVVSVYLGDEGALTLVQWPNPGELGAVVTVFDGGRIDHETAFDLGSSLERSLRALPATVTTYESLYDAFAVAWSTGDRSSIVGLYAPGARVDDELGFGVRIPFEEIADSTTVLRWDPVAAAEVFGDSASIDVPAVFLGPTEYGNDPQRAVGIYRVTNAHGCEDQVAVRWILENGVIVNEQRFHETESYRACATPDLAHGWWSGVALPTPSDQVATGSVETSDGATIEVRNGTPTLVNLFEWGLGRFAERDLPLPRVDAVTFEPSRSCGGRSGRLLDDGTMRNLYVCMYDSDVCTGASACVAPGAAAQISVLHELAHAWILDHVDHDTADSILALSGRTAWDDPEVPWIERGVEYAADVIAWGLIDETLPMVRLGAPPCTELADAFTQLTGTPLAPDRCQ